MESLGFSKISSETWLKPDRINSYFVRFNEGFSEKHIVTENERLEDVLKPQLSETVPVELHRLFEVARGAIAYGYCFYPLYTLGAEQLLRVVETAVKMKCDLLNTPKTVNNYYSCIEYLVSQKLIKCDNIEDWHLDRKMRNYTSHPTYQMLICPNDAIRFLYDIANKISSLFL